ncbi:variant erythrocyte surface antigen-1 alpha subunit [Babesia bovis T2Bo]|uniref:Variant erythrocyte surface antigen-1, alpha subunit n=1 Tax=Babesia bovis TaxID=5865 RepID=A7ATV8_BABBO|nr:variant erythrocyte surface antigen-1 alpha subunit [Babesia bovis T2Bo]EDO06369.1 variant erythrocyte surface antigen-1 alpha subunit [Babesia bovis T2Bo]|eukprot:XP_001609937.1 variant erythrocyte surface antigen-1, alpha subunit [Babesia bovis T2Bo]
MGARRDECICGLAAAVTDLLQSVQLEYHGYEGESEGKGANSDKVKEHLNGLFSLVQGLGGTSVVRTYIDQLAQVLSALVGWSKITKCDNSGCKGTSGTSGDSNPHGQSSSGGSCEYLNEVTANKPCEQCRCMKWDVPDAGDHTKGHHLGRGCTRCKDSGGSSSAQCSCGSGTCTPDKCQCAIEGKCCKCYCKEGCKDKCKKDAKCSCIETDTNGLDRRVYKETYQSAYGGFLSFDSYVGGKNQAYRQPIWNDLNGKLPSGDTIFGLPDATPSQRRQKCAQILLGSVCLIWSGITYMYWTGRYAKGSPYWNNHILDGSGIDDGSLSQWLQALGFPRDMLNNSGPGNRWDAVIWDGLSDKLLLGFAKPSGASGWDTEGNTARNPFAMNFAGFVHTAHRDSFNNSAIVFHKNGNDASIPDTNQHKRGALFKLYILSCAYFTGLQKKNTTESTPRTPKTIREILYWLSALPYSQAYKDTLDYAKGRLSDVLKKPEATDSTNGETQLKFIQTDRPAPITVHEYNLFAHFQAVTQYCPLVLIGIQGGIHSTTKGTKEPPIHSLYANTECHFTYPTVSIQAYNQVVHYIRALFYQLYFLRKQCAVKVTCGGKWRECRYGQGVVSKGVISWMCLGCDPMEHDRNYRVKKVKEELDGVIKGKDPKDLPGTLKEVLEKIGDVVVQLGNAQEALEGKKKEAIEGVQKALEGAKEELDKLKDLDGLNDEKLKEAKKKLVELTNGSGNGILGKVLGHGGLETAKSDVTNVDPGKNKISDAIDGVHKALEALKDAVQQIIEATKNDTKQFQEAIITATDEADVIRRLQEPRDSQKATLEALSELLSAIDHLLSICNTAKCPGCKDHATKCGQPSNPSICKTCLQPTTTGVPSPLQAFLEDRLPGFSCSEVPADDTPDYPPAASHLHHTSATGQCCPLPMGFRNSFYSGSTGDMTGSRLYGILYFFSNGDMMQSCVYTLVRVTAALSATTPQVLGDVFGFFRGGVGEKESGKNKKNLVVPCDHNKDPSKKGDDDYFCGWCASGLRDVVKEIEWIEKGNESDGGKYRGNVGEALIQIKGEKDANTALKSSTSNLSRLTKNCQYLSPLTGELYTAVSATFGNTYLSWVLYLSDALHSGLESLASAFQEIECRGCKGNCDPNKCKKGHHGASSDGQCGCQPIVSCTGVLPVLYRHGFSYGNPFNLEEYQQKGKEKGDYSIAEKGGKKQCHEFLSSLQAVIQNKQDPSQDQGQHPLTNLLSQVGKLQYDIRLPWIFVLTVAWLVAVLYLAFGAIWPLDWTHMRSHWLRGGEHQWQCMWYKVMTGRKGRVVLEGVENFGQCLLVLIVMVL